MLPIGRAAAQCATPAQLEPAGVIPRPAAVDVRVCVCVWRVCVCGLSLCVCLSLARCPLLAGTPAPKAAAARAKQQQQQQQQSKARCGRAARASCVDLSTPPRRHRFRLRPAFSCAFFSILQKVSWWIIPTFAAPPPQHSPHM